MQVTTRVATWCFSSHMLMMLLLAGVVQLEENHQKLGENHRKLQVQSAMTVGP